MTTGKFGFRAFFGSIRLAIVLLSLIAVASVLGTLIPQQQAAGAFLEKLSPGFQSLFQKLQIFDVYHSVWFILLMLLLAVNLIVCSWQRFPTAWRQVRGIVSPERPELFAGLPSGQLHVSDRSAAEEADRLEALLRKRCGKVVRAEVSGATFLAGQKGGFSRLGVYGVHLGVLLLLAGGIVGALFGVQGVVQIAEGESSNTLVLRGGGPPQTLDYSIRCDKFTVEFYDNGAPKTFRSDLTFLKEGRIQKQGALLVNHPLDFGGLRFYQSSYGAIPGGRVSISWTKGDQEREGREVAAGDHFDLPGAAAHVEVLRVEGDLMKMGPAVKLSVVSAGREFQFWVFANIEKIKEANPGVLTQMPVMNPGLYAPYLFSLDKTGGERFYTVLQAVHDPGTPLVAAGAGLMIVGLMVAFFYSHRRLWIRVEERKGKSRIAVAGMSNRDDVGLGGELQRLMAEIRGGKEPA